MNISLDTGFRFLPPDEEIINFFLLNKMKGDHDRTRSIREVELLKQEPWDLPALSIVQSRYPEWFFFYKLNNNSKGNNARATKAGFWKSTGPDRMISYGGRVIGTKKTLVFYTGRTPRGVKTDWVMHEYHATADFIPPSAESSYVVGFLRNKAAENTENSVSNDGQPSTYFAASSSQNNAVGVSSMEVAPQLHFNSMDYEIALQTQMEDHGIFDYDLSPFNGLLDMPPSGAAANNDQNRMEEGLSLEDLLPSNDLVDDEQNEWQLQFDTIEEEDFMTSLFPDQDDMPPSGAATNNDQNRMEEGLSLEDLLPSNDLVDDEQNEWQLQFDTIEDEDFMTSLFPDQDEFSYLEAGHPLRPDYRAPDYDGDSSDTDPKPANAWGCSEGFNQKRMENGVHHDEILIMDSSVDSATVTAYENNCLELVREEKSVNSRTCKSQYEPRSHKSVVQRHPKRVQLQAESSGKAVSRDKTSESCVRGPVVELVQKKKSNKGPKMDRDRNTKSDLNSRSNGSAGSGRKNSSNFLEMSQLSCKSNTPLVYVGNVLLGVILFIVVVREVMFLH